MSQKHIAVFGLYPDSPSVARAVQTLASAGFSNDDISVLMPDHSTHDLAHEKHTKAPEGTTAGVTTGGILGGAFGVALGLGALAIPGLGPFIAAGPLVAGLAGLGAGGAVGGFIGALAGMGVPEYEAKRYEGHLKQGRVLLSVHCDNADQVEKAKALLVGTGATDIAATSESKAA